MSKNLSTSVESNPIYSDDVKIRRLVGKFHSPLYVFHEQSIRDRCNELRNAIPYEKLRIRYACKALTLQEILKIIHNEGLWIDASSINEVQRCLLAGFSPTEIYYTGEGASAQVYRQLSSKNILINCTSMDQIRLLASVGGTECSIRINPGEGHGANTRTNTGGPSSKHGIYFDQLEEVRKISHDHKIRIVGIHSHIGSGTNLDHWLRIKDKTLGFSKYFKGIEFINLGGGLPVIYDKEVDEPMPLNEWGASLASSMREFSQGLGKGIELQIEPGRYIVAGCGLLIAEVQAVKDTAADENSRGYKFVIVNTGMNHNIRPAMYGSFHPIRFIASEHREQENTEEYVVAGYLCESGDVFTADHNGTLKPRRFGEVKVGDLMVMAGVGAYSHSMKSEYNSMNLPASILIDNLGKTRVIERRGTIQDIIRRELEAYNQDDNTHP